MSFFTGGDTIKKYEKEVIQAQLDNEKAVLKQLEKNYADALEEVNSKIAELMGRADADMQHVIYQVEYQKALKAQIQGILKNLQSNEFSTVSEYLTKCYDEGFLGAMYAMQQQGVPLVIPMNQEEIVAAIQHETNLSSGLYKAFDTAELQKKIAAEISRGFTTGALYSEIARNVAAYAGISKNNAKRIVRTEGHRITETAAHHAQQKAKDRGADVVKIWDSALDARTRPSHVKVDGEIRELEKRFSNGLMFPGDPSGKAAEVINCRCRSRTEARWALNAEQTKILGDTSEMTPEQRKRIANKLGIPESDLDLYSGQVVPINAKNYKDFKKKYNELWHYEGSDVQRRAEERIAGYEKAKKSANSASNKKNHLANSAKSSTMKVPKDYDFDFGDISDNLVEMSEQIGAKLDAFSLRASKWSGKTAIGKIKDMPGVSGRKEWSCDITLREDAEIKTVVHEHLHARSVSYYSPLQYTRWYSIEEGTVEFYAQEICQQSGISFRESYKEEVKKLKIANSIMQLYDDDFVYAADLFAIPMPDRYAWLRSNADQVIREGRLSQKSIDALNDAVEFFKRKV